MRRPSMRWAHQPARVRPGNFGGRGLWLSDKQIRVESCFECNQGASEVRYIHRGLPV